jgi:hypothetical protein
MRSFRSFDGDTGTARANVAFQRAAYGALGHLQAIGGQGPHDPVHGRAWHVVLVQQPGPQSRGEAASGTELTAGPASTPDAIYGS